MLPAVWSRDDWISKVNDNVRASIVSRTGARSQHKRMYMIKIALSVLVALVMIGGGVAHLMTPENFSKLVPTFLPAEPIILVTGILQLAIGIAALIPATRGRAGLAFAALCLAYLPLHLWDYLRPDPVFIPPVAATVRVVVQLLFIWAGHSLWKRSGGKAL